MPCQAMQNLYLRLGLIVLRYFSIISIFHQNITHPDDVVCSYGVC